MEILVIRHAQAEDDSLTGRDFDRKLTSKGKRQSKDIGKLLRKAELVPELVLTSPVVRARDTATLLCGAGKFADPLIENWLSCGMRPEEAIEQLGGFSNFGRVAIVGHQPDLGMLVEHWLGCDGGAIRVRKAEVFYLALGPGLRRGHLQAALPWQFTGR